MGGVFERVQTAFTDLTSSTTTPVHERYRQGNLRDPNAVPVRTVIASIAFFTIGTVFLVLGVNNLPYDRSRAISMLVLGSIAFLPGSWSAWNLYGAWARWPGYKYSYVPSYDD